MKTKYISVTSRTKKYPVPSGIYVGRSGDFQLRRVSDGRWVTITHGVAGSVFSTDWLFPCDGARVNARKNIRRGDVVFLY
jgi:hypothetical protein